MLDSGQNATGRGKAWAGYAVAGGTLVWVFHDVDWAALIASLRNMHWWWLAPAVAADIASYGAQGARWSLLLRPLGRLPLLKAAQAIYAGLFTNEVLPLRMGEVLRGYLAGTWSSLPLTLVFSSILVERFLDGLWTALALGLVVLLVPLPRYLVDAEEILAGAIFAAAAVFIYAVLRKEKQIKEAGGVPARPPGQSRWTRLIAQVASALGSIGGAPSFFGAVALSGLLLALQAVSFWLVMKAYGLPLSLWQGAAVLLIVHLGTMVPGAPSNVGTYQFFTVVGLLIFGVEKTTAAGFSLAVFVILTVPLWAVGLVAFGSAGLNLRTIREEVSRRTKLRVESRTASEPPGERFRLW
jgi:uncharacterized protein (TIRG00374 family)